MPQKVIKIYLKGESTRILNTHLTESGVVIKLESTRNIAVPSKKNQRTPIVNRQTGKTFLKSSDQYIKWKSLTKGFWEGEYWKLYNAKIRLPIVRCKINIIFYFGDDKDKDCTNKAETIMDALVEHQILGDDSFKVVNDVSLKGFLCRDRPRTEIYITIIDPEDPDYSYDVTDYDKYKALKKQRRQAKYQFNKIASI
jgi:hypothetical protein